MAALWHQLFFQKPNPQIAHTNEEEIVFSGKWILVETTPSIKRRFLAVCACDKSKANPNSKKCRLNIHSGKGK